MLRDPALIPLSQQHHNGLALCILTERAMAGDGSAENLGRLAQRIIDRYEIELTNHFGIEENTLFPAIRAALGDVPSIAELIADHRALERMVETMRVAPTGPLLREFCGLLRRHIRREENELFQDIQQRLPLETLSAVGKQIDAQAVRVCL
ncbi:MAG: hemerythrin domain-containing protein [Candidatus Solibacter usitatus]|nr:hemerythrin domain-containing protein [Candidatus Solibacter usitatus]